MASPKKQTQRLCASAFIIIFSDIGSISDHIIGEYEGEERGPLIICMAGMHGNEPAGVEALETVFVLLEREPRANPKFHFRGKIVGLLGNLQAYRKQQRMLKKDLNRLWTPKNIQRVQRFHEEELHSENRELKELLTIIEQQIETYRPDRIIMLDLHTTSAAGGIFAIATDNAESVRIAMELHAPVITGMLRGINGTTLHYFTKENMLGVVQSDKAADALENCKSVTAVAFEAGQHEDPLSTNRCMAAIINCMRSVGCVQGEHVENRHDELLIEYSKDLPKIAELVNVHHIGPLDGFKMRPGYRNFQHVRLGEPLADDRHGAITASEDGMVLMPLYQPQGSDGFFLIKEIMTGEWLTQLHHQPPVTLSTNGHETNHSPK